MISDQYMATYQKVCCVSSLPPDGLVTSLRPAVCVHTPDNINGLAVYTVNDKFVSNDIRDELKDSLFIKVGFERFAFTNKALPNSGGA